MAVDNIARGMAGEKLADVIVFPDGSEMKVDRLVFVNGASINIAQKDGKVRIMVSMGIDDHVKNGINTHSNTIIAITPANMDYAIKQSLTDGIAESWTDTEKIAALLRMGCTVDSNGFVKWNS